MPASHPRHRLAAPLAGVVLAVGLLAGCAGQRTPTSYTSAVQRDFIKGCVATAKADAKQSDVVTTISNPKTFCTCAFTAIKKDLSFSQFKKITDDLTEKNAYPPKKYTEAYSSCLTKDQKAG